MNINPSLKEAAEKLAAGSLSGAERDVVERVLAIPATTALTRDEKQTLIIFRAIAANHSILVLE